MILYLSSCILGTNLLSVTTYCVYASLRLYGVRYHSKSSLVVLMLQSLDVLRLRHLGQGDWNRLSGTSSVSSVSKVMLLLSSNFVCSSDAEGLRL
jgi:hypothetical protein